MAVVVALVFGRPARSNGRRGMTDAAPAHNRRPLPFCRRAYITGRLAGPIEERVRRGICFQKRVAGLEKKAEELTVLCDAHVSFIVLSYSDSGLHHFATLATYTPQLSTISSQLMPSAAVYWLA
ncbi:hypothetical protein E2562_039393 [Oryza meyeriana var. granulata]|uniref:MADS-box domain-containing protein n=1 Tax=Oryza meyeriana var. granulata TaxID=110450 RepID=A0A6G1EUG2_9ORYZ|nr:hypothetical protein E2562_039393 [Oryza meyeriana var. granulata]